MDSEFGQENQSQVSDDNKSKVVSTYELVVNGYKCPDALLHLFTPLEFEEIVQNFIYYDVNKSDSIDVHEIRKLLFDLGQENSIDKAQAMLDSLGETELDFEHYCQFIVMIKQGDPRLAVFSELVEKLHNTPLGIIDNQAKLRDLKIRFVLLDQRDATSDTPAFYLFELQLEGMWYELVNDVPQSRWELKKYQGIGPTSREAKYDAVKYALAGLESQMPGVKFKEGDVPSEWLDWLDENLLRGVHPLNIARIFRTKGFHIYRNPAVMQKLCTWLSLEDFLTKYPLPPQHLTDGSGMNAHFRRWVQDVVKWGMDGEVVMEVLELKGVKLSEKYPQFAQKLKQNEMGVLVERDGVESKLFDFWQACEEGAMREVELFLESGQSANDEKLGRHDNVARTPLLLAAMNNRMDVVRVLLARGADVHKLDTKGRSPLHVAAEYGVEAACQLFLEAGARIFDKDMQGNSPVHLAARGNHASTVALLLWQGQEFTRALTGNIVLPRRDTTFELFVKYIFETLPEKKLHQAETRRFEKAWLLDACNMFYNEMDSNKRYMVARPSPDIITDVLKRFDARPETGLYVITVRHTNKMDISAVVAGGVPENQGMQFVPTVESASDLADLIRFVLRQASLDETNNMKRTTLHMACEANVIRSHEETIKLLVDGYGCNVWLRDMNGKRAFDLLAQDKKVLNAPSATHLREEVIFDNRETHLIAMSEERDRDETDEREARQEAVFGDCVEAAENLSVPLWHVTREAALLRKTVGVWDQYEDPDTGNFFFTKQPVDELLGDPYSDYSWNIPEAVAYHFHRAWAWIYQRCDLSDFRRTVAGWEVYGCQRTGAEFYYHPGNDAYELRPPYEVTWAAIGPRNAVLRRLGFHEEWEEHEDKNGNFFYRKRHTSDYFWHKPRDAVSTTPVDLMCTVITKGKKSVRQKYFTCEQCNKTLRDMQSTDSDSVRSASSVRICEPCAVRCHVNHRGVRFLSEGVVQCSCHSLCRGFSPCCARHHSRTQQLAIRDGKSERLEYLRVRERNAVSPFVFAMVPRYNNDGSPRLESGWMICRRVPPQDPYLSYRKVLDAQQRARELREAGRLLRQSKDIRRSRSTVSQSVDSVSKIEISDSDSDSDDNRKSLDLDDRSKISINRQLSATTSATTDDEESIDDTISTSRHQASSNQHTISGSESESLQEPSGNGFLGGQPLSIAVISALEKDFPFISPEGLPEGWIEVYDPMEPANPAVGTRVLWWKLNTGEYERRYYGTIMQLHKGNVYTIRPSLSSMQDVNIPRDQFEVLERTVFYCNPDTGESAWTIEEACNNPIKSQTLCLAGSAWTKLQMCSQRRRTFDRVEELEDKVSSLVFYMDESVVSQEVAVVKIQHIWRQKHNHPRPRGWISQAFTFDPPEDVLEEQRELSGWALLRRRSKAHKSIRDVDGVMWLEFIDSDTGEHFYWYEDENVYQWDFPRVPERGSVENFSEDSNLHRGQEVLYKFPNRPDFEPSVVTKIREDDSTGEIKYDLQHKFVEDLKAKWVPRILIRRIPMSADDIELDRLEKELRFTLRRTRDAQARKHLAKKQEKAEEELARRYKRALRDTHKKFKVSVKEQIALARDRRIKEEQRELDEANNRELMARHNVELEATMKRIASEHPELSRSEVLQLTRAVDLQLDVRDRLEKRNVLQRERQARIHEAKAREEKVRQKLAEQESSMTTPRSLSRREVLRHLQMAMRRQSEGFMVCQFGCGEWVRVGREQLAHEHSYCVRRIITCALGCHVKMSEEDWLRPLTSEEMHDSNLKTGIAPLPDHSQSAVSEDDLLLTQSDTVRQMAFMSLLPSDDGIMTVQLRHERMECGRRLVPCPRNCMEWVVFEELHGHMEEKCIRRPAKPIYCRLGCGVCYGGEQGMMLEAEEERLQHESEECEYRLVRCNWVFENGSLCAAQIPARERDGHRDLHLTALGVSTYVVSGTYVYKVPKNVNRLKIQVWGAGGGSGMFRDRKGGSGGGGAFVEALLRVSPHDVLEIVVGSGGGAGVVGTPIQPDVAGNAAGEMVIKDAEYGTSAGGNPGGGQGFGGGHKWAAGGGGGYSMIAKRTPTGTFILAVAAGGGGGSSNDGLPGGGTNGPLPGTRVDKRNGGTATMYAGGECGESGNINFSAWPAQEGTMWQGGYGCEFGGGGGGGYYGGGGGGVTPGIGGGGGGGASFLYVEDMKDFVIIPGNGRMPGGLTHDIPEAVGIGEWDTLGARAGEGGAGDPKATSNGYAGAVRIYKPGFY